MEQYYSLLAAADVVVNASLKEGAVTVSFDSMAMGKPLIVSNMGGLPELVEDGVNGYIYEKTAENLADCIRKLQQLKDEDYRAMASASLERAKKMFSPTGYVEQIESYYKEWMTEKGR